jgi:hypothetical protein
MAHGVSPGSDDIKLDGKEVEDEEVEVEEDQTRTIKKKKGGSMNNKKDKICNELIIEEIPERLIAPSTVKSKEKKKGEKKKL